MDFRIIIVNLLLLGLSLSCARPECSSPRPEALPADTPANASYLLENQWIQLESGRADFQAAPGSASKIEVTLLGEVIRSDINYDGAEDAVLFMTYQGGGSGTFFYLAAALREDGTYLGTNGIWLGDRISSPTAKALNGLISVEYLDRGHDEPMTAAPGLLQTRFFILDNSALREIIPAADEAVYLGWLTIGHEVRSFLPCDESDDLWLLGKSPALDAIMAAYGKTMAGFPPYTPVFALLTGRKAAPPGEGFGAGHKGAFSASLPVRILPKGNCRSNLILLDSPLPGANISSPLVIKGRARGTWFFEGDFPVLLLDEDGEKIAESYAAAKGEWMTENFVEFDGIIQFSGPFPGRRGTLLLKKDNPTGLAKFDDALEIPINFK